MQAATTDTTTRFRNALWLRESLHLRASRTAVYEFIVNDLSRCYRSLAEGHELFEVEGGGPIAPGAVIDCRERAGSHRVHHRYVVRRLDPGAHIHYASTPSRTWVTVGGRERAGQADTHVFYTLQDAPDGGTRLDMAIVIVFEGWIHKALALLGGTRKIWQAHQREELGKLAAIVERREARRPTAAAA